MKKVLWQSCGLMLAVFGLVLNAPADETNIVRRVSVDEFEKLSREKDRQILDVRTEREFAAGHITGATNIDFNAPDFAAKIAAFDKTKVYLVHCAAGGRSARACEKMKGMGFRSLVDLPAGFHGWEKAGKPVEKKAP
jgi:rhodanese-related sulfurtransferase